MALAMYHKNFKHLTWLESIEVARPKNWYFSLYVQKWGNFEPLYLGKRINILKNRKSVFSLGS